jgi:hypothetical protein
MRNQSDWTLSLFRDLHKHLDPKFPSIPFIDSIWSFPKREIIGEWVENWLGFETINRLIYGESWYPREDSVGKVIDDMFNEFYDIQRSQMLPLPEPLYPCLSTSDCSVTRELLPFEIMENEANINAFLYLSMSYGFDIASEVLKKMYGDSKMDSQWALAFAWLAKGIGSLFPMASDIAFQGCWDSSHSFEQMHPSWRFMKAWEACLAYEGCDKDGKFLSNYSDIESDIITAINGSKPDVILIQSLKGNGVGSQALEGDTSLTILLRFIIEQRIKRPYWFYSPVSYLDYLCRQVPVPFVRFSKSPWITRWLGPNDGVFSDRKTFYKDIFNETFLMWSGRDIATSERVRCPLCEYIGDSSCTGECLFGQWFLNTWGCKHNEIGKDNSNGTRK